MTGSAAPRRTATSCRGTSRRSVCPFCRVMLTDGLVQRQSEQKAENVDVRDVAQLLLERVKTPAPTPKP